MKKVKLLSIMFIIAIMFMLPVVHAHSVILAKDGMITIPDKITETTKIEVAESFGEYKMYYQWVAMNDSDYEDYLELLELQQELEVPGSNATSEEIAEYESEMLGYEASKTAVKPAYIEGEWTETSDGTVAFNKNPEGIEEGDPFVLWIKVVNLQDETKIMYDERLILYAIPEGIEDDVTNADTSDNILVIGALAVVAVGIMMVSYKKSRA